MNSNLGMIVKESSTIVVTHDNTEVVYSKGDQKFEELLEAFVKTIADAREMPAFGVSLDEETRLAKQSGTWLEFMFDNTQTHNEMPFDALLINVVSDHSGFNLIRKYNGKYDGRCFYVDIAGDMQNLFETTLSVFKH